MQVSKSNLKKVIMDAVNTLQHAPDRHNCGSERVKIYINETGELYHTIQSSSTSYQDQEMILSFQYSRPEYNGSIEAMQECEYEGTIEEWDWENFTAGEDYINYVERLLEESIDNCRDRDIEIEE
jgi:hypothetical protein